MRDAGQDSFIGSRLRRASPDLSRPFFLNAGPWGAETQHTHVHRGLELGIVIAKSLDYWVGDTQLHLHPGDVWLCAMWEPHSWLIPEDGTELVVVTFLPETIRNTVSNDMGLIAMFGGLPDQRPRSVSPEQREAILAIVRDMCQEAEAEKEAWDVVVHLGLLRLLVELSRTEQRFISTKERVSHATAFHRMMPALKLVESSRGRRITVAEAAATCALSPSRFHEVFCDAMGVSFANFQLRVRVGAAAQELLMTEATLESIAQELGFSDASHLHHTFTRVCGCTPTEYRRLHRFSDGLGAESVMFDGMMLTRHSVSDSSEGAR